jgi:hypothetical protein
MDTAIRIETIVYESGPECPVCGRPRVWRVNEDGMHVCGTGQDSGLVMPEWEACWTCRDDMAEFDGE